MRNERVFDLICKNLYQEVLNLRYTDKVKKADPEIYIMSYEKFRSLADKMTLNMFHKLRQGKMTFQQFRSHVFQDENNLEFFCIDDLKEIYGPELFEDDPKIQQLIDNVCKYRHIDNKKKVDLILNDPIFNLDSKCLRRIFSKHKTKYDVIKEKEPKGFNPYSFHNKRKQEVQQKSTMDSSNITSHNKK